MTKKGPIVQSEVNDGALVEIKGVSVLTGEMLANLTAALGVPRDVVASDEQIGEALERLPRLLRRIPARLRDERIVKACIAVASGLFDATINYVWNAAIVELREKVRRFGLHVIPQILDDTTFDEQRLLELKDSELLDLCLRLNLITDQDFFFLDQCRATRNSYSVAHPANADVDEDEVLSFVSRCQKHALSSTQDPKGVDTKKLLEAICSARFKKGQLEAWEERLRGTFDAQRELIFGMLHGINCDPEAGEEARVNAIGLCLRFKEEFTPKTQSMLVDRHQDYGAKGDEGRYKASQGFFERLGIVALLGESEVHSLITSAARNLLRIHNDWNNFYNEPPFADRLEEITRAIAVPKTAQVVFVEAVITCAVGNAYGVSNAAVPSYRKMIRSFSRREVGVMLGLTEANGIVASRLKSSKDCVRRYADLVKLVDKSSVPTRMRSKYKRWL